VFGSWQQPGERVPPRASGVIGGGQTAGNVDWSASAYVGPWGACMDYTAGDVRNGSGAGGYYCIPVTSVSSVTVLGPEQSVVPGLWLIFAAAPAAAAKARITFANGTAVTARPVTVGDEPLFAVAVPGSSAPVGWTTYDAAGQQVGSGSTAAKP
jgi:hypothetical protein